MAAIDSSTTESASPEHMSAEQLMEVIRSALCDLSHVTQSVRILSAELEDEQSLELPNMELIFRGLGSEGEKAVATAFEHLGYLEDQIEKNT